MPLPAAADNSALRGKESAPPCVLVVDDEPLLRWSVAQTLSDSGYRVIEARDAISAVGTFLRHAKPVDVVLLDLCLPDVDDDLRVLSAIRYFSPSIPVIIMTAHGYPELAERARSLGAFAVVDKPFEMSELGPLIELALASRS